MSDNTVVVEKTTQTIVAESTRNVVVSNDQVAHIVVNGQQGPPGPAGLNAGAWLYGTGAPANSVGSDGQTYLNSANGNVYFKDSGAWVYQFTLTAGSIEWSNITNKPNLSVTFPFNDSTNIVVTNHGMQKKPAIRVIDSGGTEWVGWVVTYTGVDGLDGVVVSFTSLFSGQLILS